MFPYIQGILAFDTPYLGISPGVIAHGAETHYQSASTAYSTFSELASVFGYGASKQKSPHPPQRDQKRLTQGADAMAASMSANNTDAAATPTWQRWGKYAMFAGAAGAVAAGGAAAYLKRDTITEGWTWIGSHLEFVGCLARGEELKSRLERIVTLNKTRGIGFVNLVTVLGNAAPAAQQKEEGKTVAGGFVEIEAVEGIAPAERTFCTVPKSKTNRRFFEKARNDKAADEAAAHMTMFHPRDNPGFYGLGERAKELVVGWVEGDAQRWYHGSEPAGRGDGDGDGDGNQPLMENVMLDLGDEGSNAWAGEDPVLVEK